MRKLVKIAVIAFGIRAFLRWRKSKREQDTRTPESSASNAGASSAADPADELRRKLAETREDVAPADATEPPAAAVADRRAEVHEQGRATLDEMKSPDES